MIVRTLNEAVTVDWGNGLSRRFLVQADGMGYTLTDTIVNAGTTSHLQYRNHLEACYCIAGRGEVVDEVGRSLPIEPGTMYALDRHDAHLLVAGPDEDLRLVCVFAPALLGTERHSLSPLQSSAY